MLAVRPMNTTELRASRRKLALLKRIDDERRRREHAKNTLEAYIYATRDKLYTEADDLEKVSTEAQRTELSEALMEAEDWLYDEGDATTVAKYGAKLKSLKDLADVMFDALELMRNPPPPPPPPAVNETTNSTADANNSTDAAGEGAADQEAVDADADDADDDADAGDADADDADAADASEGASDDSTAAADADSVPEEEEDNEDESSVRGFGLVCVFACSPHCRK